jgi:DNA polymerase-3 subunit gamma/tau
MSYQVLARKYRPQRFSEVIGQDHVTRTLKNAIQQQRIAHGYIFSGHRGIGKTTIARILAMTLNCHSTGQPTPEPCGVCDSCLEIKSGSAVDVIEIDAATNRGIDEIRELRDAARYRPARDRYKIYILDEAHQITDAAFNALLKTLEEPPQHTVFMMATTQPEDIPHTIRSRCQHFSFHAVKFDEIFSQLRDIASKESIHADDEALSVLAEAGEGSMRDALSIMDQAIAGCGDRLTGQQVRGLVGNVGPEALEELMNFVAQNSAVGTLRLLDRLLTEGHNPAHFAKQLVRLLRNLLVCKVAGESSPLLQISAEERARAARLAQVFSEEDLTRFLQIMLRTHDDIGYRQEQRFHLELGVMKLVHAQRLLPLEQVLSQSGVEAIKPVVRPTASAASILPAPAPARKPEGRMSPFEADRGRKSHSGPEPLDTLPQAHTTTAETALALAGDEPEPTSDPIRLRSVVLAMLEAAGHKMLASTLESGNAELSGEELKITVAQPAAVIDLMMGPEAKRIANAAASRAYGRPIKVSVNSGTVPNNRAASPVIIHNGVSARSRASEDPVVQRMQEKFGAEIRTVIDHRDRN